LPTKPPQNHVSGSTIQRARFEHPSIKTKPPLGLISGGFSLRIDVFTDHESRWLTRIVKSQFVALSSAKRAATQRE